MNTSLFLCTNICRVLSLKSWSPHVMAKLFVVYFVVAFTQSCKCMLFKFVTKQIIKYFASVYAACPNGWWYDTAYPQLCYMNPGLKLDWQDAIGSCSKINATLPIFRTLDESVSFAKYS